MRFEKMVESNLDFNAVNCPNREFGMNGDSDNSYSCYLTGRPDADFQGWGYDLCNWDGDYRTCPIFQKEKDRELRLISEGEFISDANGFSD
jgi:hypothetical protein